MTHTQANIRRGLSIVEVAVSSLLVGTVVVGSLSMMSASVRTQTAANDMITGPHLAEELLAEIMSMSYNDPEDGGGSRGTDTGESSSIRADFDDVDDYDNWSRDPVEDRLGNQLTQYAGWTRSVEVDWGNQLNGNVWALWNTGAKRIIVTVTSPTGAVTTRYGWRAEDGSLEQPPTVDKNVVTQIESTLTLGSGAATAHGVINLLNHVEDPNG